MMISSSLVLSAIISKIIRDLGIYSINEINLEMMTIEYSTILPVPIYSKNKKHFILCQNQKKIIILIFWMIQDPSTISFLIFWIRVRSIIENPDERQFLMIPILSLCTFFSLPHVFDIYVSRIIIEYYQSWSFFFSILIICRTYQDDFLIDEFIVFRMFNLRIKTLVRALW